MVNGQRVLASVLVPRGTCPDLLESDAGIRNSSAQSRELPHQAAGWARRLLGKEADAEMLQQALLPALLAREEQPGASLLEGFVPRTVQEFSNGLKPEPWENQRRETALSWPPSNSDWTRVS